MVFVTLGTQDKPFKRLLVEIQDCIDKGLIEDTVVVQAGVTKFKSDDMIIQDFLDREAFEEYIDKSDLIICHGGVGSILCALKKHKKVIAVPRLKKYHEHVNDHQLQIIDNFIKKEYIVGVMDVSELKDGLKKVKNFEPKPYKSNKYNMINLIEKLIED